MELKSFDNDFNRNADWIWILDPLDGTKDFIQGTSNYAMHLALNYKRNPFLGIVLIPEKNQFKYQNLGNLGSPIGNIFYEIPKSFSLQSGLSSLQPYIDEISTSKFYDTKSPFIDLGLFFGGLGRSKVDFEFSRNVNKNWNLTLAINRISSDKQIGAIKNKGDKNIKSSSLKFNIFHIYKLIKLSIILRPILSLFSG